VQPSCSIPESEGTLCPAFRPSVYFDFNETEWDPVLDLMWKD